jgi:hypothetical protein
MAAEVRFGARRPGVFGLGSAGEAWRGEGWRDKVWSGGVWRSWRGWAGLGLVSMGWVWYGRLG